MAAKTKYGSVRRFGARYGTKVRAKLGMVESASKKMHKCPYCNHPGVKRLSLGIYECRKCASKFTGKAYTPIKKIFAPELEGAKEAIMEEEIH